MHNPRRLPGIILFWLGALIYIVSFIIYATNCGSLESPSFDGLIVGGILATIGAVLPRQTINQGVIYAVITVLLSGAGVIMAFVIGFNKCFIF
jgi:lysophospholipid acyltransferase (LPLAT)-like uncharacterized protein